MTAFRIPGASASNWRPQSKTIAQLLLAQTSLLHWWRFDDRYVDVNGTQITRVHDQVSDGAIDLTPFTNANYANLVPNLLALDDDGVGFPAAVPTGTSNYTAGIGNTLFGSGVDHGYAVIFREDPIDSVAQSLCGKYTDLTHRSVLDVLHTGVVRFICGNAVAQSAARTPGRLSCVIAGRSGNTAQIRVDGVNGTPATITTGDNSTANFYAMEGDSGYGTDPLQTGGLISDILVFNQSPFAVDGLVRLIELLATKAYQLPFTPKAN